MTLQATHGMNTAIGIQTGIVTGQVHGIIVLMIGLFCIRIIITQVVRFDNNIIHLKLES